MKRVPFLLFLFLTMPLWGQRPSDAEVRHMNILILNTLDEYIRTSSLSDRNDIRDFLRLFEDPDRPCVYNDLAGTAGYQGQLTPRAYSELVNAENGSVLRTEISRIRKSGDFYFETEKWHRRISIQKYVMLIDASVYTNASGGILFDSDQLYSIDPDYHLVLDLVYDAEADRVQIAAIQPLERKPSLPVDKSSFTVVLRPDDVYAGNLYSGNTPLSFNEFGQAIVENGTLNTGDDDLVLRLNTLSSSPLYTVVEPVFKKYHIRIRPRYAMTLNGAFQFSHTPEKVNFTASSKSMEAGVDLGVVLGKFGRLSRIILYTGAAFSGSNVNMVSGPFDYQYGTVSPIAYRIEQATEAYSFSEIVFPAFFEWETSLGSRVVIFTDVGGKFYLNQNDTVYSPFHVEGSISSGGKPYSPFASDFDRFIAPASYGKQPYDVSIFGELGVDIKVVQALYLSVSGGYEFGVMPAFTSAGTPFYREASGSSPAILPIVYAGGKHLAYHSFADCVSFNRQAIWLSAGLKIKL